MIEDVVVRTRSAFEQEDISRDRCPSKGHAIILAWLMLLGPAVVGPSAKHSSGAAVSYPCLAQRALYPSPQVNHNQLTLYCATNSSVGVER